MDKKNWLIFFIIAVLILLVILFWNKLVIKKEELVSADYCEADSDCVLAVSNDTCCMQPVGMNKKVVELDSRFAVYDKSKPYPSPSSPECAQIHCVSYPPVLGVNCSNSTCAVIIKESKNNSNGNVSDTANVIF